MYGTWYISIQIAWMECDKMRMQIKSRLCRTRKLNFLNNIVLCCELENGVFSLTIYFSIVFFYFFVRVPIC